MAVFAMETTHTPNVLEQLEGHSRAAGRTALPRAPPPGPLGHPRCRLSLPGPGTRGHVVLRFGGEGGGPHTHDLPVGHGLRTWHSKGCGRHPEAVGLPALPAPLKRPAWKAGPTAQDQAPLPSSSRVSAATQWERTQASPPPVPPALRVCLRGSRGWRCRRALLFSQMLFSERGPKRPPVPAAVITGSVSVRPSPFMREADFSQFLAAV